MIKVENIETFNWEGAIRGLRNPMNSWYKSDSHYSTILDVRTMIKERKFEVGKNDLDLMCRLYKAGTEHRKYLRQIFVSMDITAPLYWWAEFDTYKIGTTRNSCSKMHKIHSKPIELSDFSFEDYYIDDVGLNIENYFINVVADCEELRQLFLKTKDKKYWRALIQLLPESYNQKSTITMNYENVVNIIHQRSNHKLTEWVTLCEILKELPYIQEIMGLNDDTDVLGYTE